MTYKCIIVDDEALARELIQSHLSQLPEFEIVALCSNALEANGILQKIDVDLIFLDIEMPVLNGTDFLKNLDSKPKVIFTTAHRNYALEGFDLDAVDYLLKPISFARFFKATQKFLKQHSPNTKTVSDTPENQGHIFITKDRKQVKLRLSDVSYIESFKDYISIHTSYEVHTIKSSLSSFEGLLDGRFIRVHRSYVVNKEKITAFTKYDIELGEIQIPIGDTYKDSIIF
jgi:DNA-binding LytR/AlgR family response regulator